MQRLSERGANELFRIHERSSPNAEATAKASDPGEFCDEKTNRRAGESLRDGKRSRKEAERPAKNQLEGSFKRICRLILRMVRGL